jgi:hypothetical protein
MNTAMDGDSLPDVLLITMKHRVNQRFAQRHFNFFFLSSNTVAVLDLPLLSAIKSLLSEK